MGVVCNESDYGSECKKHPRWRRQPGVCAACLTERLSELSCIRSSSSTNNKNPLSMASSHSSSPPYSSSAAASPTRRGHYRTVSINYDVGSLSFVMSGTGGGLIKSRSVAFSGKTQFRDVVGRKKKKGGFWSKLFRPAGKRTKQVFWHSRSPKESFDDYYL